MLLLILGLILFLGMHSARLFVADKRASFIAAKGPLAWKGIYALVSIVGFVLIILSSSLSSLLMLSLYSPSAI